MQIIPFELIHLAHLGRPKSGLYWDDFEDMRDRLRALPNLGPCWTLEHDGKILACGGIAIPWPGVGEGWLICAKGLGARIGLKVLVLARRMMRMVIDGEKLHRLQGLCVGKGDDRLYRALGFNEPPVPMRKFTPKGRDCTMYARVC